MQRFFLLRNDPTEREATMVSKLRSLIVGKRAGIAVSLGLMASLTAGGFALAQGAGEQRVNAIFLPAASCTPDNPAQRASFGGLSANVGLIQNLSQTPINVSCALVRTGGLPAVSVTLDAIPGRDPVRARLVATATAGGASAQLQTANVSVNPGPNGGFQRASAAIPVQLSDDFGLVLRITVNPGDTIGRILLTQRGLTPRAQ
jgi:hypothetical protein